MEVYIRTGGIEVEQNMIFHGKHSATRQGLKQQSCRLPTNHSQWCFEPSSRDDDTRMGVVVLRRIIRIWDTQRATQSRRCIVSAHINFHQLETIVIPDFLDIQKFAKLRLFGHLVGFGCGWRRCASKDL